MRFRVSTQTLFAGFLLVASSHGLAAPLEVVFGESPIVLRPGDSISLEIGVVNRGAVDSAQVVSARLGLEIQGAADAVPDATKFGGASAAMSPLFEGLPLSIGAGTMTTVSVGSLNPIGGEVLAAGNYAGIATLELSASAAAMGKYFVLLSAFDPEDQFGSGLLLLDPFPIRQGFSNGPDPEFGPRSVLAEVLVVPEPLAIQTLLAAAVQLSLVASRRHPSLIGRL